jgi:hypothetical protein
MSYLRGFPNHKMVTANDIAKSIYAVHENNVVNIFEKNGYSIHNYLVYDFKNHPSQGNKFFEYIPELLIKFRTLDGRIEKDIGWNFHHFFEADKAKADSLDQWKLLKQLDKDYNALIKRSRNIIKTTAGEEKPGFFLFHFMLPHEPYLYNPAGKIDYKQAVESSPEGYIEHLKYTNTVVYDFVDCILASYQKKNIVIVIQGDHGYKWPETDPLYDKEGCKNLYAVYCSDKNYSHWYKTISSVNGFRIIFNKYFKAHFPLLPDNSYSLYYR